MSNFGELPAGALPYTQIVRNLTTTKYGIEIPAGAQESVPYKFTLDMNPKDLKLQIVAVLQDQNGAVYQVQAYNEKVSIVEPATSFLDPQMYPSLTPSSHIQANKASLFLYLVLASAGAGTMYFVYKTWLETLFPQTKKGGKGGERARRSLAGTKKAVPVEEQLSVIGGDGPAVTNKDLAQKAYDENWIPDHHINRPSARRVKSGKKA